MSEKKILVNKARCLLCDDVIVSRHRHDFVRCKCGQLHVDGGTVYLKRGYAKRIDWEELSEFEEEPA